MTTPPDRRARGRKWPARRHKHEDHLFLVKADNLLEPRPHLLLDGLVDGRRFHHLRHLLRPLEAKEVEQFGDSRAWPLIISANSIENTMRSVPHEPRHRRPDRSLEAALKASRWLRRQPNKRLDRVEHLPLHVGQPRLRVLVRRHDEPSGRDRIRVDPQSSSLVSSHLRRL